MAAVTAVQHSLRHVLRDRVNTLPECDRCCRGARPQRSYLPAESRMDDDVAARMVPGGWAS